MSSADAFGKGTPASYFDERWRIFALAAGIDERRPGGTLRRAVR